VLNNPKAVMEKITQPVNDHEVDKIERIIPKNKQDCGGCCYPDGNTVCTVK